MWVLHINLKVTEWNINIYHRRDQRLQKIKDTWQSNESQVSNKKIISKMITEKWLTLFLRQYCRKCNAQREGSNKNKSDVKLENA